MAKIIRHEFLGSWLLFLILCLTGIGIPVAILYLINKTVSIEEEVSDPVAYIAKAKRYF